MTLCVGLNKSTKPLLFYYTKEKSMDKKLVLTINAAEKRMQFLFSNEQGLLYAEDFAPKKGGTELLLSSVYTACQKLGISCHEITHIACVAGPGNFMGIRISAVTLAALMRSLPPLHSKPPYFQKPSLSPQDSQSSQSTESSQYPPLLPTEPQTQRLQSPLDYLQCVAANIPAREGETVRVLTSATKTHVHARDYIFDKNSIPQASSPLCLIPIPNSEQILQESNQVPHESDATRTDTKINNSNTIKEKSHPTYIIGSGLSTCREYFKAIYPHTHVLCENFDNPSIDALYRMSTQALWQTEDITPIYLKECDALQNLDHIATQQGRKPEEAHRELERLMHLPTSS